MDLDKLAARIAASVLSRTVEGVLADEQPYAVFHQDDGFTDYHLLDGLFECDGLFAMEEATAEDYPLYSRRDFDFERSLFADLIAADTPNKSLRELLAQQGGMLFGRQVTTYRLSRGSE